MNLTQLQQFIRDRGVYQDYPLNEYAMLRYFLEQIQPRTIQIVGGFTNLDLFYAGQNLPAECRVTNWDPCVDSTFTGETQAEIRDRHREIQQATGFQAQYEWIPASVARAEDLPPADLIWLQGILETAPPPHAAVIMTHFGRPALATPMVEISRHSSIRCMGRKTAVFSQKAVDMSQGPYPTRPFKFLLWDTHEVLR